MYDIFIPGRVCLFGEHTDWVGGMRNLNRDLKKGICIVSGTDIGVYANVKYQEDKLTYIKNNNVFEIPIEENILKKYSSEGGYYSYICGVLLFMKKKYNISGMYINNYKNTIIEGKGLSTSAAICVLIAKSINLCYNLKLSDKDIMNIAYQGEILTPSRCGRMDQCVALGKGPFKIIFDGDNIDIFKIKVKKTIYMIIVELGGFKDTTTILQNLQKSFPFPKDQNDKKLEYLFGEYNINVINDAISYIENGDIDKLGFLMTRAQSNFDKYTIPLYPDQFTSPLLHELLNCQVILPHIFGGKGVGSQGDGSAQLICKSNDSRENVLSIINKKYPNMTCNKLTIDANNLT